MTKKEIDFINKKLDKIENKNNILKKQLNKLMVLVDKMEKDI